MFFLNFGAKIRNKNETAKFYFFLLTYAQHIITGSFLTALAFVLFSRSA